MANILFQEVIMDPLDHKSLDKDVPYFANVVRWVCMQIQDTSSWSGFTNLQKPNKSTHN